MSRINATELARLAFRALETGDAALSRRVLTEDHVNHMAADEPPACREHGAPGFLATSAWLRLAFSELGFEVLDVVAGNDQVVGHVRMTGVHTGPFVVFPPGGKPQVFPATGRRFSVRQFHLFRLADGRLAEHVAVRDDLGMMTQLGFIPPVDLPRAFRTADLWLIHAAGCCSRYSLWTCCGVRY